MNNNLDNYLPPKYFSYIEKYRIYEIFQTLAKEVIINKPIDHVVYVKSFLMKIIENGWDMHKIILFIAPEVNLDEEVLAKKIAAELGTIPLSGSEIINDFTETDICIIEELGKSVANVLREKFKMPPFNSKGWLIYNYPRSQEEGYALQRSAVLPTCCLLIEGTAKNLLRGPSGLLISDMEKVFNSTLKRITIYPDWGIPRIVEACCSAAREKSPTELPILYRVVMLGPPGCTRHYHAQALADKFNLVYVDFQYVLRQAGVKDVGKRTLDPNMDYKHLTKILHKKMYHKDCLVRGWVLTHFPYNVDEFKILDNIETPPNRVIILTLSQENCKYRILEHDLRNTPHFSEYRTRFKLQQVEEFYENEKELRDYCGKTYKDIDAMKSNDDMQTLMQQAVLAVPTVDLVRKDMRSLKTVEDG